MHDPRPAHVPELASPFVFSHGAIDHKVYKLGAGPAVVLMHELPGLTAECLALARAVATRGYTVYLPLFFGELGGEPNWLRSLWCIRREFNLFAARKTSPVVDWLRALSERAWKECGGRGVAAIGMCLTGNFAIALLAQPWVRAPVVCQPSLPIRPFGPAAALGLSDDDLAEAKAEARRRTKPALIATRFEMDPLCPPERLQTLEREFGDGVETIVLPGRGHSTLTAGLVDDSQWPGRTALERILAFVDERLKI